MQLGLGVAEVGDEVEQRLGRRVVEDLRQVLAAHQVDVVDPQVRGHHRVTGVAVAAAGGGPLAGCFLLTTSR